jgi:hypothetical protein
MMERAIKSTQEKLEPMGQRWSVFLAIFIMLCFLGSIYGLVKFWPGEGSGPEVTYLFLKFTITNEVRMIIVVALAGAVGGLVHTTRSFYFHATDKTLHQSWLLWYILRPLVGSSIGLITYLIIRGGFITMDATVKEANVYSFTALAALAGMFSEQAVEKLKRVAELILTKVQAPSKKSKTKSEKR